MWERNLFKCFSCRRDKNVSKRSISGACSLDESLIWSLSGFRSAREGNMISLECSWKTRQWSAPPHAVSQPVNKIKLFTVGLHYPSRRLSSQPQQFSLVPTNQPPSPSSPRSLRLCCWISFLGDEFIQIGALSKRALSRITCLLGGSVK